MNRLDSLADFTFELAFDLCRFADKIRLGQVVPPSMTAAANRASTAGATSNGPNADMELEQGELRELSERALRRKRKRLSLFKDGDGKRLRLSANRHDVFKMVGGKLQWCVLRSLCH